MLVEFLTANRGEILTRTRLKVAARIAPQPTVDDLEEGIPLFFDQLVEALRAPASGTVAIKKAATSHGKHRMRMEFAVSSRLRLRGRGSARSSSRSS
jgi:hypothetical protein